MQIEHIISKICLLFEVNRREKILGFLNYNWKTKKDGALHFERTSVEAAAVIEGET